VKPAPFDYVAPASLEEALELRRRHAGESAILAGGQSLVPSLNLRLARPAVVIDVNGIAELQGIRAENGTLVVGATTRQRFAERHADAGPLLREALSHVAHPAIRTRGTIGGSVAHADPAAEVPAVVALHGGTVVARSVRGERTIAAADFFTGWLTNALEPDELLTEVRLPALPAGCGTAFVELSRRHGDFALVGVAAMVAAGDVRVALTGVDGAPALRRFDDDSVDIGREVAASLDPPADLHATAAYRRRVAAVLVDRALALARSRAA
jgi:carbon-monoxide dehydrogenase medium subunit